MGQAVKRKPPAPSRKRMSTAQRREFYEAAKGDKEFPTCNICGGSVLLGQKWVESHMPIPHTLGGTETGVAHARCNADYWAKVEAPMLAKVNSQYDKHRGIHVSRHPMAGGKDDPRKRRMSDGLVVDRVTGEPWRSRK
jgi:hypothetical protein